MDVIVFINSLSGSIFHYNEEWCCSNGYFYFCSWNNVESLYKCEGLSIISQNNFISSLDEHQLTSQFFVTKDSLWTEISCKSLSSHNSSIDSKGLLNWESTAINIYFLSSFLHHINGIVKEGEWCNFVSNIFIAIHDLVDKTALSFGTGIDGNDIICLSEKIKNLAIISPPSEGMISLAEFNLKGECVLLFTIGLFIIQLVVIALIDVDNFIWYLE